MKNFRLFETEAEHNEAVIEECSVSYVVESNKLYTTPENNGEITFKILVEYYSWENNGYINDTLTLKAAKDMTWGDFIDSEYNTLYFRNYYDTIIFKYHLQETNEKLKFDLKYDNGDSVGFNDDIIPNYKYCSLLSVPS